MASYVFPKVEPADIQRSNRNLSLYKPFTISAGVLAPVLTVDMLPGDWMRVNTIATVQSLPMIAPVRGRWKCSFDYYYQPWSNLYGWMDNNTKLSIQSIVENKRWTYKVGIDQDSVGLESLKNLPKVGRSSLLDFLGIPVGYYGSIESGSSGSINLSSSEHPAEGLLTYIDIIRNYYINNQIGSIPFVAMASDFKNDNGRFPNSYENFSSATLDSLFAKLRYDTASASLSIGSIASYPVAGTLINSALGATFNELGYGFEDWNTTLLGGLFLRNYRMDLLRGILSSSVGSYASKINVQTFSGVSFVTADDIYFGNKLQQFINRIDISGGRFSDWIRTRWNVDTGTQVDRPIHLGSHSLWLNTIDVVATAAGQSGEDVNNPNSIVGQQVGYQVGKMDSGSGRDRQRAVVIKSKQYGTLQCIFSITPDVVYSQGIELNNLKTTFADIFDPAFKQLGFQDVSKIEMDAFPILNFQNGNIFTENNRLVGKRIAWSEYMASLNRCHGDFAYGESLDYWVNNRVYTIQEMYYPSTPPEWFLNNYQISSGEDINEIWLGFINSSFGKRLYAFNNDTYVYPHMWNNAFAIKSISQMNYMVDVYFQIDASRNLGKRIMPKM